MIWIDSWRDSTRSHEQFYLIEYLIEIEYYESIQIFSWQLFSLFSNRQPLKANNTFQIKNIKKLLQKRKLKTYTHDPEEKVLIRTCVWIFKMRVYKWRRFNTHHFLQPVYRLKYEHKETMLSTIERKTTETKTI